MVVREGHKTKKPPGNATLAWFLIRRVRSIPWPSRPGLGSFAPDRCNENFQQSPGANHPLLPRMSDPAVCDVVDVAVHFSLNGSGSCDATQSPFPFHPRVGLALAAWLVDTVFTFCLDTCIFHLWSFLPRGT